MQEFHCIQLVYLAWEQFKHEFDIIFLPNPWIPATLSARITGMATCLDSDSRATVVSPTAAAVKQMTGKSDPRDAKF
jgi:hypothetical protein